MAQENTPLSAGFFPRKDQSVKFPEGFPLTLPNLLKFLLRHSSPSSAQPCLEECRVSFLEREIQRLRVESQALREAQALLRAQLSEARREEQRLQQEGRALRKQQGALQSQREHLQGLCSQKSRELEGLAGRLRELAEASKTLLAENTLLKVLLASVEGEQRAKAEPDTGPGQEEEEEEASAHLEATMASEHSRENWTEQPT